MPATFDDFFRTATATENHPEGNAPYAYQRRLATGLSMEGPAPSGLLLPYFDVGRSMSGVRRSPFLNPEN